MENHPAETLTRRKKSFVLRLACRRIRLEKKQPKKISEIQNAFLYMAVPPRILSALKHLEISGTISRDQSNKLYFSWYISFDRRVFSFVSRL